jgi:alanyl-tRNA synthetase
MTSSEIREKYRAFFVKHEHKWIPPASLVPENDPTTLFTSSGMQPLVPYLLGQPHPEGKRLCNSQPSFRSQDIEEVGDNRHTTFFEMLGNWSLGDYFKKEQLAWFWEFLTHELNLDPKRLFVSVFEGNDQIPKDTESESIWKSLGLAPEHIVSYDVKKNWWSRSGTPDKMPTGEIGGPDSEVFYEFTQVEHDQKYGKVCHPNCDCGRFLEIGNSVFIQYQKQADGSLKELPNKNVDFGGGLERLTAAVNNEPDMFKIDLFLPIIETVEKYSGRKYSDSKNQPSMRIIADHMKAATVLIVAGVRPSNKTQGYVLRRLLRRSSIKWHKLGGGLISIPSLGNISDAVLSMYDGINGIDYGGNKDTVQEVISDELLRFGKSLDKGLKEVGKIEKIDGKIAFDLYQSYGFPLEITEELFAEKGQKINHDEFQKEFEKHRELSRSTSAGMFKGGLANHSETTTKYHTATHLLHAALRKILGDHVQQKGSNITDERLRFDFSHTQKVTDEELKLAEQMVNDQIKKNMKVTSETMKKDDALNQGALGFFTQKYGDNVTVYTIGDFSKEICGGPHVDFTGTLGTFRIEKEESAGSGVRRIYATLGK